MRPTSRSAANESTCIELSTDGLATLDPTLEQVLDSKHPYYRAFTLFCEGEFSSENPAFVRRVEQYKSDPRRSAALRIVADHIAENADGQVNISSPRREKVEKVLQRASLHPELFDQSMTEVVEMMKSDTFPRFLTELSSLLQGVQPQDPTGAPRVSPEPGSAPQAPEQGAAAPQGAAADGDPPRQGDGVGADE
jgi:hypothetical protein